MTDPERRACPCDGCDRYALGHDKYCVTCIHHGCGIEVQCNGTASADTESDQHNHD